VEDGTFDSFAIPQDELDEAVTLLEEAIEAGSADTPLPASFPKNVIPLFDQLGRTLEEDERIEFEPPNAAPKRRKVIYSPETRRRIMERATGEFTDLVTLTGEVRLADLDGGNFILRRADGSKITGKFSPEHEAKITEGLKEHQSCSIAVEGTATFCPDGQLKRIEKINVLQIVPKEGMPYDAAARPIWEVAEEIGSAVPAEDWENVPEDASIKLHHYLNGL
jgi:hypothetical protein